jgi:hypothetical protein
MVLDEFLHYTTHLLNFSDKAMTAYGVSQLGAKEANPLMLHLMNTAGVLPGMIAAFLISAGFIFFAYKKETKYQHIIRAVIFSEFLTVVISNVATIGVLHG